MRSMPPIRNLLPIQSGNPVFGSLQGYAKDPAQVFIDGFLHDREFRGRLYRAAQYLLLQPVVALDEVRSRA